MTEAKTHFDKRRPLHACPGLPRDLYPGAVITHEHLELLRQPAVVELIQSDEMPIPATEDRENYYDERHIEYWISGLADCRKMESYLPSGRGDTLILAERRGVYRGTLRAMRSGRFGCATSTQLIAWIDQYFNRPIRAFQNRIQPSLPLEDGYFDLVSAFSVFTHLDQDEMPWLLELRRILRPGGYLYLTVLDENVWIA